MSSASTYPPPSAGQRDVSPPSLALRRPSSPRDENAVPRGMSPLALATSDSGGDGAPDRRRPSVQFRSERKIKGAMASPKLSVSSTRSRKMSSPPPPPVMRDRVSFDTFVRDAESLFDTTAFTLTKKHKDYEYSRRSRTFLCGLDANEYSEYALEWLIDELVDDGDEVVCLRVVDEDASIAGAKSLAEGRYRTESQAIMDKMQEKNVENKAISLVLEFAIGKVPDVIDDMIKIYEPAILIVGTRGRSLGGFQGLLPGSVSKWVLQHSPVPVIVVRPNSKREKHKRKRLRDPARTGYRDLLDKSDPAGGGHILDFHNRHQSIMPGTPTNADAEAAAVAAALGITGPIPPTPAAHYEGDPLMRMSSQRTNVSEPADASELSPDSAYSGRDSPEDLRSPARLMKSPAEGKLETPDLSEASSDEETGEADDTGSTVDSETTERPS